MEWMSRKKNVNNIYPNTSSAVWSKVYRDKLPVPISLKHYFTEPDENMEVGFEEHSESLQ